MPSIPIRDIDIHYEITGEGEPLLLIHGLGSSSRDWAPQVHYFSKLFQVVTFDVRGHRQSSKPPGPYSILQFTEDTAELINALDIGPAHVAGISMGGMIAFQLTLIKPELVKSLVVINSGPDFTPKSLKQRLAIYQRFLIVRILGMRAMGKVLAKRLFPKPNQDNIRSIFIERWAENDKRAYLSSMKAIFSWNIDDQLSKIKCPVLILAADEDYTPVSYKEEYTKKIPNAELVVISDSRHAIPVEHPDKFNQVLMSFLSKQV